MLLGLYGGIDAKPRDYEAHKHNEQYEDDCVGDYLEGSTGSSAILMQVGMHRAVMVGDSAQVVFNLV